MQVRFHEAVAAMAQGSCVKSQWGAIHKYDPKEGGFCWMQEKWMKEGMATHETIGNWEIVADPSVKPLDFFGAMEALKAGKAVQSCMRWVYWSLPSGTRLSKHNPQSLGYGYQWEFSNDEIRNEWHIVPIPEATNV